MKRISEIRSACSVALVIAALTLPVAPAFALDAGSGSDAIDAKPPQIAPGSPAAPATVTPSLGGSLSAPAPDANQGHILGTIHESQVKGDTDATMPAPTVPVPAAAPPAPSSTLTVPQSAPTTSSADEVLHSKKVGDVTYITGGVGDEERTTLDAAEKDYNLRVTNASKGGEFVTDIHTVIRNTKGDVLLDTSAGPIFYAQLPAGAYTIEATGQGVTRKQNVTIGKGKASYLHFGF